MAGKYDLWGLHFAGIEGDQPFTMSFDQLEAVLGRPLPPSARRHQAWWSNSTGHAHWARYGWSASVRIPDGLVEFRRGPARRGRPAKPHPWEPTPTVEPGARQLAAKVALPTGPRLVLIGCVKTKGTRPAPAKDLYESALWRGRRAYAESTEQSWAILSAEHGLLLPERVVEPYDRYLGDEPVAYRRSWSLATAAQVLARCAEVGVTQVEVHAGAEYLGSGLRATLQRAGITVHHPLSRLSLGAQLRWYKQEHPTTPTNLNGPPTSASFAPGLYATTIATLYAEGSLGESWDDLPEVAHLPESDPRSRRLWLTFGASVDRARSAEQLWRAARQAWELHPWVFEPQTVSQRSLTELADVLRSTGTSQRHSVDAFAWRTIAESLAGSDCPPAIRSVIDGGPVAAPDLLDALDTTTPAGTRRFPLLSGPKIGPMWVRFMAWPGMATITRLEVIPVAVDTHVQRVTEMLGLVPVRALDERHRANIAEVWSRAVAAADHIDAPPELGATTAGLDPALWALGKEGCTRCERAGRLIPIGDICRLCVGGRLQA